MFKRRLLYIINNVRHKPAPDGIRTGNKKGDEKMKKLTRNNLNNKPVIKVGYCDACYLLRGLDRVGYMSGVYGWNADVYDTGAAYIVTGYRFTGLNGVYADAVTVRQYNEDAEMIISRKWNDPAYNFQAAAADAAALRSAFVSAVLAD